MSGNSVLCLFYNFFRQYAVLYIFIFRTKTSVILFETIGTASNERKFEYRYSIGITTQDAIYQAEKTGDLYRKLLDTMMVKD